MYTLTIKSIYPLKYMIFLILVLLIKDPCPGNGWYIIAGGYGLKLVKLWNIST